MKRVTTYELNDKEWAAIKALDQATKELLTARKDRDAAIKKCIKLGLPVRLIADHSDLSYTMIWRKGKDG